MFDRQSNNPMNIEDLRIHINSLLSQPPTPEAIENLISVLKENSLTNFKILEFGGQPDAYRGCLSRIEAENNSLTPFQSVGWAERSL
ncbi:MAG: hypothetical protein ACYC0J_08310 [Gammaproteobacteria bacterium]